VTRPILTPSHVTVNSGHHILKTTTVKSHQWPTLSELIAIYLHDTNFVCYTQMCVIGKLPLKNCNCALWLIQLTWFSDFKKYRFLQFCWAGRIIGLFLLCNRKCAS